MKFSSASNSDRNSIWAIFLGILLLGIHMGASEFLSVQFIGFVVLLVLIVFIVPMDANALYTAVAIVLSQVAVTFAAGHDEHYYLRAARTSLVMVAILFYRVWASRLKNTEAVVVKIELMLFVVCLVTSVVGTLQLIDSIFGNSGLFDIPESWYALEYGTLYASERFTLSSVGYFIRPTGTFSEPSAMAFASLIGCYCGLIFKSKRLIFAAVISIFVSMSMSGVLILGLLFIQINLVGKDARGGVGRYVFIFFATVILSFALVAIFSERLIDVVSGGDVSANIRIMQPLQVIDRMMASGYYFGLPFEVLESYVVGDMVRIVDNWPLSNVMIYGINSIFIFILLVFVFPLRFFLFILVVSMINGDLFYYDRLPFLILFVIIYELSKRKNLFLK